MGHYMTNFRLLGLTAGGISPAASHIQLNGEQGEISTPKKYSPRLYAYIIPPLARQFIKYLKSY